MSTITRAQYIVNSKELFNDYYLQFATQASYDFISSKFPIKTLLSSKDGHLNDLAVWLDGWVWDFTPINTQLAHELGDNNSDSTHTLVGKAIAKKMIADYHAANS